MPNKLLVIGIDGVSWNLMGKMIEKGAMPTLKKIVEEGASGKLETIVPPTSCPAWPTFFTGKNPGKTGRFSFFTIFPDYSTKYPLRTEIKADSVWAMLSSRGIRCNVVNVPITFPPEKIKGCMVSQVYHPLETNGFVYPESLEKNVKEIWKVQREENPYIEETRKTLEMFKLANKGQWDFSMVVFLPSDRIQHNFLHDFEYMRKYFTYLDSVLEEIIDSAGKDATIIVMSDHGSAPSRKVFRLTTWLINNGYLSLKKRTAFANVVFWILRKLGISRGTAYGLFKMLGLKGVVPKLPQGIRKSLKEDRPDTSFRDLVSTGMADWKRTRAFCYQTTGIHINKEGFFEKGIVGADGAEALKKEIKEKLSAELGMKCIFLPEELYSGEYLRYAPDVIFESGFPIDFIDRYSEDYKDCFAESEKLLGVHTIDGIYAIKGPGIAKGKKADLKIMDLSRLILHLFEVPSPSDFDGRFPAEIFKGKEREKKAVESKGLGINVMESRLTKEEEEKIIESLKQFDYV